MCELGNTVINHIYEGACEERGLKKPGPNSTRSVSTYSTHHVKMACLYCGFLETKCFLFFPPLRQEKEAWIKAKYVERKFLKKMCGLEALVDGGRKSHHWHVKKCRRNNSVIGVPKTRHKYRHDGGSVSPANLSAGTAK